MKCLRFGLTGVHEMGVDERTIATYKRLIDAERFPFRVRAAINGAGPDLAGRGASAGRSGATATGSR